MPRAGVAVGIVAIAIGIGFSGLTIYEETQCSMYTLDAIPAEPNGSPVIDFSELSESNQKDVRQVIETGTAGISEQQADGLLNTFIEYEESVYLIRVESVRECGSVTSLYVGGGVAVVLFGLGVVSYSNKYL